MMTTEAFYASDLAAIHAQYHEAIARSAAKTLVPLLNGPAHVLDLGCGAGPLSAALGDEGHTVFGIDRSEALLSIARERMPDGRFAQGDVMTARFGRADVATAVGEVINYATAGHDDTALDLLFRRIRASLPPDGLLLFDSAGPERHGEGEKVWSDTGDSFVAMHATRQENEITRYIVTFAKRDAAWQRSDEVHHLRTYDPADVLERLDGSGFDALRLAGYDEGRLPAGLHVFLAKAV